jgi:hypothetical protein
MRVIAYAYDADHRCIDCTKEYIKATVPDIEEVEKILEGMRDFEDSEGNPIHPLFSTDEWYANDIYEGNDSATLACGTCGEIIEEVELNGDS